MLEWMNQLPLEDFWSWQTLISAIDILIVTFFIYQLIKILRGTRATELLKGILVIILLKIFSSIARLYTTEYIIDYIIQWSVIALIIIFQPELRRGLEHLGRGTLFSSKRKVDPSEATIKALAEAIEYMSRRHIGALISLEMEASLGEYIATGISIRSDISAELLINIFIPNTPLHDGAVIISDYQIASAASYLPLSDSETIPKKYGTRHRAAIGLSEVTDAITLVVSEETGSVSIAHRGNFMTDLSKDELVTYLTAQYVPVEEEEKESFSSRMAYWIRKVVKGE